MKKRRCELLSVDERPQDTMAPECDSVHVEAPEDSNLQLAGTNCNADLPPLSACYDQRDSYVDDEDRGTLDHSPVLTELDTIEDFIGPSEDQGTVTRSTCTDDEASCSDSEEIAPNECRPDDEVEQHLYPGCPLTLTTSSLLLMKFKMRHSITEEGMRDLLTLIRIHCPVGNSIPKSLFTFNKMFTELQCSLSFHYFCGTCFQEVEKETEQCPNMHCSESLKESGAMSSFISIPLEPQLKSILERKSIILVIVIDSCCADDN